MAETDAEVRKRVLRKRVEKLENVELDNRQVNEALRIANQRIKELEERLKGADSTFAQERTARIQERERAKDKIDELNRVLDVHEDYMKILRVAMRGYP